MDKYMRVTDVAKATTLGKSTIWLWVKQGKFPAPKKISNNVTVWMGSDIQKFLEAGKH